MGVARYLRSAWAALPGWARWVLAVYLAGFADGTAAHARDLARAGFHAYSGFPQVPLRVFFSRELVPDPARSGVAVHSVRHAAHHRVRRVRARHGTRDAPRHKDRAGFSAAFRGISRTINQAA